MRDFDQLRAFRGDLPGPSQAEVRSARARLASEIAGQQSKRIAPGRHRAAFAVVLCLATAVIGTTATVLLTGSASESQPAYAAEVVRFAESTPLLLLEGPGWRVENVYEAAPGPFQPRGSNGEGSMEFITGKPIPDEAIHVTDAGPPERVPGKPFPVHNKVRESGMLPPSVRQRKVELRWFHGSLSDSLEAAHETPHPHGQNWIKLPVLGTTATVDTRAEWFVNQGGPGNRQMTALWAENGYVLELRAAVPSLAAFEERLGWLNRVDSEAWLDAMPPSVVKAADHVAVVREMLRGIPLPHGFKPSLVPNEGITTSRAQVSAGVVSTVACLWFRQWGEARRDGDREAVAEAEKAMATSKHWPILRQQAGEPRAGTPLIWQLAEAMPSGMLERGPHRWRLLPQAEALGCARWGIPVLPWKQRRQQERQQSLGATASAAPSRG